MLSILLDTCVWGGVLPILIELGYDAVWSGTWPQDPGDSAILAIAHTERRVLITLDKDFGELAIVKGLPHSGMIRLTGFRAGQLALAIHHILGTYHQELILGAIITANPERVRIRKS